MLCSQRVFLHIQVGLSMLCTCMCVARGGLTCFTLSTRAITGAQRIHLQKTAYFLTKSKLNTTVADMCGTTALHTVLAVPYTPRFNRTVVTTDVRLSEMARRTERASATVEDSIHVIHSTQYTQ